MHDPNTGKRVGWIPVIANKENKYHLEAFDSGLPDGTYELLGPKIQGNPEIYPKHVLEKHSEAPRFHGVPKTLDGIREFLRGYHVEGIVFHHPDGRMGKIKKKDFGMKR